MRKVRRSGDRHYNFRIDGSRTSPALIEARVLLGYTKTMFLWSKDASPGWLQQHETLIARFGNALAIIERPGHKRSRLEVACKSREQARELVNNFGGRLETLPRDWLERV